jgi:hypothetical protein
MKPRIEDAGPLFIVVLVVALLFSASAFAAGSGAECCVGTSATEMKPISNALGVRSELEVQNNGAASIWCAIGDSAKAVVSKCREVKTTAAWPVKASEKVKIFCIATVAQSTGACAVCSEVP